MLTKISKEMKERSLKIEELKKFVRHQARASYACRTAVSQLIQGSENLTKAVRVIVSRSIGKEFMDMKQELQEMMTDRSLDGFFNISNIGNINYAIWICLDLDGHFNDVEREMPACPFDDEISLRVIVHNDRPVPIFHLEFNQERVFHPSVYLTPEIAFQVAMELRNFFPNMKVSTVCREKIDPEEVEKAINILLRTQDEHELLKE